MTNHTFFNAAYGSKPPENYERYFVPAIGEPLARDLIRTAALRPGDRVLDVACGTGIVARLAAQQVGSRGTVAGLDVNPGMLAVARSVTPAELPITWYEAGAEDIPLPDDAFDLVFCQISLQFMVDKIAALREMRRVLVTGGRLILSVPGPAAEIFAVLASALERHISPQAAGFVNQVFSLHEPAEIQKLLAEADFRKTAVQVDQKRLILPSPEEFLWQYVTSTPLAGMVAAKDEQAIAALELDVVGRWQEFNEAGCLKYYQRIVVASARK